MQSQTVAIVTEAIRYIESHLGAPLGLDQVAASLHYSKYHLHRSFTKTAGITLHDYVSRRRLTEAARLLTDTRRPILDIAFQSGYGSQQAFTDSFRAMYKTTPARFRETEAFYPPQDSGRQKPSIRYSTTFACRNVPSGSISQTKTSGRPVHRTWTTGWNCSASPSTDILA